MPSQICSLMFTTMEDNTGEGKRGRRIPVRVIQINRVREIGEGRRGKGGESGRAGEDEEEVKEQEDTEDKEWTILPQTFGQ